MLFHVSEDKNLISLTPNIPQCAVGLFEDKTIPRVCFSDSISGCLSSIEPNINRIQYVYTSLINNLKIYKPNVLEVRDAKYTGEIWILEEVKVKLLGKIKIENYDCVKYHNSGRGRVAIRNYPYEWI